MPRLKELLVAVSTAASMTACLDAPVPLPGGDAVDDGVDTGSAGVLGTVPDDLSWSRCGHGVVAADLSGDGADDLIFLPQDASANNRGAIVIASDSSIGTRGFFRITSSHDPRAVHVEDLDDDGAIDLLALGTRPSAGGSAGVVSAHFNAARNPTVTANELAPSLLDPLETVQGAYSITTGDVNGDQVRDVFIADPVALGHFLPTTLSTAGVAAELLDISPIGDPGGLTGGTQLVWSTPTAWFALVASGEVHRVVLAANPLESDPTPLGRTVSLARKGVDSTGAERVFMVSPAGLGEVTFATTPALSALSPAAPGINNASDIAVGDLGSGSGVDVAFVEPSGGSSRVVVLTGVAAQGPNVSASATVETSVTATVCHAAIGSFLGPDSRALVLLTNDGGIHCFELSGGELVSCRNDP